MASVRQLGRMAWRKYNIDGASGSGFYKPDTVDIFPFTDAVAAAIDAIVVAAGAVAAKATKAALEAVHGASGDVGIVYAGVDAGIYIHNGSAWVFNRELPEAAAQDYADAAESAKNAAEAARDIAEGYASDAVSQGNVPIYGTFGGISGLTIPGGISGIIVNGRAAVGDGGRAFLKKVGAGPATSGRTQSADGAWWEVSDEVNMAALGGKDDNATNNTSAMQAAASLIPAGGRIVFPRVSATGVYLFTGGILPVNGLYLDVEPGVTLKGAFSRPQSPGENPGAVNHPKVIRRTRVIDTSTGTDVEMWLNPEYLLPLGQKPFFLGEGNLSRPRSVLLNPASDLVHQYIAWPAGDTWAAATPTTTAGTVQWPVEALNRFRISFRETRWAEQVDVSFSGDADAYLRAAAIRTTGGHYVFWADRETNALNIGYKATGVAAVTSAVTIPGAATHDSQKPQWALWGIQAINPFAFAVLINGVRVKVVQTIAPITHIGFGVYNTTTTPTLLGWRLLKSKSLFGVGQQRLLCHGDSTVADIYGGWPWMLRQLIEGSMGIRVERLTNRAVGGWSSADVLSDLQTNGINDSNGNLPTCAFIRVGANDIQAATSRLTYISNMEAIMDIFIAAGVPVVVAVPAMFYSQALGGGSGQATSNYYFGAAYRAALQQSIAAKYASSGLVFEADNISSMGHVLGSYKGSDPLAYDQILRDNIHQTDGGYHLDAYAMARAALDALAPETTKKAGRTLLPSSIAAAGMTLANTSSFSSDSQGQITLALGATFTSQTLSGTAIATLPASLKPAQTIILLGDAGNTTSLVRVIINTDGTIVATSSAACSVLNIRATYARE
ncbi:SGNH/GDSL hydrolase family protein [Allorhizobium borbori]|uniref:Uncharacterized protein n=1 Tax=Allorhizobium borbori TaxID=485907 RepID=A0A7W6K2D7_9HYPH|nr:SGNH/GDSL hydrolase family protein [Allorhizobium borbori]MBB4103006.1 hypothetical protein [Allorhizobium borbori]